MQLPTQYAFLTSEPGPKMLVESLKLYGIKETPGEADNPVIIQWAAEIGLRNIYRHDETSWCGLDMAVVAKRAGYEPVNEPLWALNWAKFGKPSPTPMLGDLLVFKRYNGKGKLIGGHITLYVGEDKEYYHGLGGNQSDMHNITRIAKARLFTSRRPVYNVQPANVRVVLLGADGPVTTNEA